MENSDPAAAKSSNGALPAAASASASEVRLPMMQPPETARPTWALLLIVLAGFGCVGGAWAFFFIVLDASQAVSMSLAVGTTSFFAAIVLGAWMLKISSDGTVSEFVSRREGYRPFLVNLCILACAVSTSNIAAIAAQSNDDLSDSKVAGLLLMQSAPIVLLLILVFPSLSTVYGERYREVGIINRGPAADKYTALMHGLPAVLGAAIGLTGVFLSSNAYNEDKRTWVSLLTLALVSMSLLGFVLYGIGEACSKRGRTSKFTLVTETIGLFFLLAAIMAAAVDVGDLASFEYWDDEA